MKALLLLLLFGPATAVLAFATDSLDGLYAELPSEASDSGQMTVALAGALLSSERFDHVEISGRIEKVRVVTGHDVLRVVVYDSSKQAIVEDTLKLQSKHGSGRLKYVLKRRWTLQGSGESGAASGETTTTLSKDDHGDLRLEDTTVVDKSGIFSRAVTSHDWRVYAHLPEPAEER